MDEKKKIIIDRCEVSESITSKQKISVHAVAVYSMNITIW
jgi:hypothetical protein